MNLRRFLLLGLSVCALSLSVGGLLTPSMVQAQVDPGLAAIGQNSGLGTADPRVIAARIINIALGFVGIILVSIMVYAGFLWMTAGGKQEQVEQAQKYIRNAIIGVIIIVSAWAITTFVINKLLGAVGGGGGGVASSGGGAGGGDFGTSGGAIGFQVRSISPAGPVSLRNIEVRFLFTRDVQLGSVTSSIKILRASDSRPVEGALSVQGNLVTFTPRAACPAPASDRRCFEGDVEFIARVERSLRSNLGQSLACGALAPPCEVRFRTGNRVDTSAPRIFLMSPIEGQSVPQNDAIRLRSRAEDESGISLVESFVNGRSIGREAPSVSSTAFSFESSIAWDTRGLATGTYRLESQAYDIDSNRATSSAVSVALRPRHCFNNVRDADETGLDCGGSSCGACSGSSCIRGIDCAGAVCGAGSRCVDQPVITSVTPSDGRVGTYVTISGLNFGTTIGQVMFGGRPARSPEACLAVASSTLWGPSQVIVTVPEGATTGSVSLLNRSSNLSDTTNDDRGPRLPDFRVNNLARPGLCGVRPDRGTLGERGRVEFHGVNLGERADRVLFDEREFNSFLGWNDRTITMSTPIISAGGYAVRARVGSLDSNTVGFYLYDRVLTEAPVIDSIDPANAAVGEMITLVGRNFGTRGQVYFRNPATNALGLADTSFPDLCRNDYWRNNAIIVKVPRTLRGGLGEEQAVRPGRYEVYVRRDGERDSNRFSFDVTAGPPGPSVCAILPSVGPVNTRVTMVGERFGITAGAIAFSGAASGTMVTATVTSEGWREGQVQTTVPSGSASGLVHLTASGRASNGTYFRVANCREDVSICGIGSSCCADGSCSVGGVCPVSATSAHFAWVASTGRIRLNPAVVDECNNEQPPSPSPRGSGMCVNAQIVVRFTTKINPTTINERNVIIRRCTGTRGDPCSSGTPEIVAGRFAFRAGATQDAFVFTPGGSLLWNTSSTYEVILKTGIHSTEAEGNLPMLENALRYGTGNAYAFRFITRSTPELCRAGSVSVDPYTWLMEELGQEKEYNLSPRAEGNICVQLNPDTMGWSWSVSDAGKARLSEARPSRSGARNVRGIGATARDPVLVTAELTSPVPPIPVRGNGRLTIRIAPPRVEAYAPNCNEACVNAAIWARFNVPMELESLYHMEAGSRVPNILVKRCVNESCREFDRTLDLAEAPLTLEVAPGFSASNTLLKLEPTHVRRDRAGAPELDRPSGTPLRETLLEPERYYKVWILGGESGIRSEYGRLLLTNVNDTEPLGFSWKFRVRGGTNPRCSVDRVAVAPGQKYESTIGARQMFSASPVSAPDACSRDGQMLITDRPFNWSTSDRSVADFARTSLGLPGTPAASIALATRLPAGCTDRCTNAGSQAAYGQAGQCGNRVVETADTNYCRRRSDPARRCEFNNPDCVTRFGDACLVLPPGAPIAEECDNGASNGPDNECTTRCLWNRQPRVTDLVAGTCGNGTIQRGEQCDPGRVCATGPRAGTECTSDPASCGTGHACTVTARRGCSDACQALGSSAGGSTCGNSDVADGETCDNQIGPGNGCTRECLHIGSSAEARTVCGNARLEPGESCETSVAGNLAAQYCQSNRSGALTCSSDIVFSARCDSRSCLNLGTDRCTAAGATNCCGNTRVEPGEDCDGEEGCSSRCLRLGSSPGYRTPSLCGDRQLGAGEQCEAPATAPVTISHRQLFEITGLREPTREELDRAEGRMAATLRAEYDSKRGESIYGVQCSFTQESSCTTPGTGLTSGGCCAPRPALEEFYPTGSEVCRNVLISASFNQLMDERSVSTNFIVAKNVVGATTCASGTTPLNELPPVASGWRAPFARAWLRLVSWVTGQPALADVWCAGTVHGEVTFHAENGKTRTEFLLGEALEANTQYRIVLRGEDLSSLTSTSPRRGIRSFRGVRADGDLVWNFTTGNRICTVDQLTIYDTNLEHPFVFYRSNEAHRYLARAVSIHNGAPVPISPIPRLYAWSWVPWISSRDQILRVIPSSGTPALAVATTTAQNRSGTSSIGTGVLIEADTVNTPSTVGQGVSDTRLSTVILCENPWVPRAGGPPRFTDDVYNFATAYCKDAGQTGVGDDLPDVLVNLVPPSPSDASRGILRQYLFSFDRASLRGDGIGIRILANPLHLSPREWYRAQGFAGTPQSLAVDGYEAIQDGDSVYVGAVNADAGLTRASTNIYLISRNANAGPEASHIFDQLVANLAFNTNVTRDVEGVCRTRTGGVFQRQGGLVRCSADWECLRFDTTTSCGNAKAKLQRDLKRINDFQFISSQLEVVKSNTSRYPTLASGSFLQSFVSSRWPSWQGVLGSSLGVDALPQDPLNVNLSCGVCLQARTMCMADGDCPTSADRCLANEGFDPMTCWNAARSAFKCPILAEGNTASVSRQYQYQALAGGARYQLATELEQLPATAYQPALLTEIKRCVSTSTSNGRLCETDRECDVYGADRTRAIAGGRCSGAGGRWVYANVCRNQLLGQGGVCGDGILSTTAGEVCELGQTQSVECSADGGRPGRKAQVCREDCRGYIDGPDSQCNARLICGNGRPDAGEVCDEGSLNGSYGHCNRTCSGYAAMCGDEQLSSGEVCDEGTRNGQYCNTAPGVGSCSLASSCSADCRDTAPHCGDGVIQAADGEVCDGAQIESTTSAVCFGGDSEGRVCTGPGDCPGGQCGGDEYHNRCVGVGFGQCAGGTHDRERCDCSSSVPGTQCDNDTTCGRAIKCIVYPTRRTRSCVMPRPTPVLNQCRWDRWTACIPEHYCGDGVLDTGEECDDGNRSDNDACTAQCKRNVCGDRAMYIGVEECDFGPENGQACTGADYGSTCAACTNQCRMTASSGGFCGDNHRNGGEQCDGGDLSNATSTLSCTSLGFDYAESQACVQRAHITRANGSVFCADTGLGTCDPCWVTYAGSRPAEFGRQTGSVCLACGADCVYHEATTVPTRVDRSIASQVCTTPVGDNISCGRSCSYAGCRRCSDERGTGSITATVYDAVYSITPVQGARVTLYQNGVRLGEQTTSETGVFTFNGLNQRAECSGYRIVIDLTRDNPRTTARNEATNGGYWPYESSIFGVETFRRMGIENENGKIFLIPRVGPGETLAVTDWNGSLPGCGAGCYRYVDAHLILPFGMRYPRPRDPENRDVYYRIPGNTNMSLNPHANLFCFHSEDPTNTDCGSFVDGPEVMLFKRGDGTPASGRYSFLLNDFYHSSFADFRGFLSGTNFRVRVVTQDRLYLVRPPNQSLACNPGNWLVFQQDVATGAVSIPGEGGRYLCDADVIPGEAPGVTPARLLGSDSP